jgi:hypothetical protein
MNDTGASFLGGFSFGAIGSVDWIAGLHIHLLSPHNLAGDLALQWGIKVLGTMILGVVGGLAGLFAKDLYRQIKKRFTK